LRIAECGLRIEIADLGLRIPNTVTSPNTVISPNTVTIPSPVASPSAVFQSERHLQSAIRNPQSTM
jgi:hypothetical protein